MIINGVNVFEELWIVSTVCSAYNNNGSNYSYPVPHCLTYVFLPCSYIGDLVCKRCLFVQILRSSSYDNSLLKMPFSSHTRFTIVGMCCLFISLWPNFTNNTTFGKLARKHPDWLVWPAICLQLVTVPPCFSSLPKGHKRERKLRHHAWGNASSNTWCPAGTQHMFVELSCIF